MEQNIYKSNATMRHKYVHIYFKSRIFMNYGTEKNRKRKKAIVNKTANKYSGFGMLNRLSKFSEPYDIDVILLASLLHIHHFFTASPITKRREFESHLKRGCGGAVCIIKLMIVD